MKIEDRDIDDIRTEDVLELLNYYRYYNTGVCYDMSNELQEEED